MERTRDPSLFSKFEHLFSNNLDDRSSNKELSEQVNVEKRSNQVTHELENVNKKAERISQKTVESCSSEQNQ